jgi:hypothetical protein
LAPYQAAFFDDKVGEKVWLEVLPSIEPCQETGVVQKRPVSGGAHGLGDRGVYIKHENVIKLIDH